MKERHGGGRSEARIGQAAEWTHDSHDETRPPDRRSAVASSRAAAASAPPIVSNGLGEKREAGDASNPPETAEMEPR